MHLVQDISVPNHTRNDFHMPGFGYETWVENNIFKEELTHEPFDLSFLNFCVNCTPGQIPYYVPISALWDIDVLTITQKPDTPPAGLAEYSNMNFFSEDTIFHPDYPYPRREDVGLPQEITEPDIDGIVDTKFYLSGTTLDAKTVNHLAYVQYFYRDLISLGLFLPGLSFGLDDFCYEDYATILVPKAVTASAALLNYFFRGKLQTDITGHPGRGKVEMQITNKSNESLYGGKFELYYDNTAGNRGLITLTDGDVKGEIPPNGTKTVSFSQPSDNQNPGEYILVFKGGLGNEGVSPYDQNYAVIGKWVDATRMTYIKRYPAHEEVWYIDPYNDPNTGDGIRAPGTEFLDEFMSVKLSPQGEQLAFTSGSVDPRLFIVNYDGTNLTALSLNDPDTGKPLNYFGDISWRYDGAQIAFYARFYDDVTAPPNPKTRNRIYVVNSDGTGLSQVYTYPDDEVNTFPVGTLDFSPNGLQIVFTCDSCDGTQDNRNDIYRRDVSGAGFIRLTNTTPGSNHGGVDWSREIN